MATYATTVTTARLGASTKAFYAGPAVAKLGIVSNPRLYAVSYPPDALYVVMVRDYAISRTEGGSGNATRPLTGLLHPPDRRGNRAQAATG